MKYVVQIGWRHSRGLGNLIDCNHGQGAEKKRLWDEDAISWVFWAGGAQTLGQPPNAQEGGL